MSLKRLEATKVVNEDRRHESEEESGPDDESSEEEDSASSMGEESANEESLIDPPEGAASPEPSEVPDLVFHMRLGTLRRMEEQDRSTLRCGRTYVEHTYQILKEAQFTWTKCKLCFAKM